MSGGTGTAPPGEVCRLHDWKDKVWSRRYSAIVISDEEAAQVDRLRYILANGCKEGLVASPRDWPGVNMIAAVLDGKPLTGTWFNRTKEYAARLRGESSGEVHHWHSQSFPDPVAASTPFLAAPTPAPRATCLPISRLVASPAAR